MRQQTIEEIRQQGMADAVRLLGPPTEREVAAIRPIIAAARERRRQ